MNRRTITRRVAALACAAVALTACATTGGDEDSGGGGGGDADTSQLVIAIDTPVDTLDPAAQNSTRVMMRVMQMVESLTQIDEDGELQPLLATEWEMSDDGLTYDFTLREGVEFSDGTPFNADAVKFSLDRLMSPDTENAQSGQLSMLESTEVIDDTHVRVTLSDPFPPFLRAISQPMAGMVSPEGTQASPNTLQHIEEPIGTGPYTLNERAADGSLVLEKNADYWGDAPTFDVQEWRVIPDASSRLALLKSGEADLVVNPPASSLQELQSDDSVTVGGAKYPGVLQLELNTQSEHAPLLQNVEVRQALVRAVDQKTLLEKVAFGAGAPVVGLVPDSMFGYCDPGMATYDPEAAEQMLAEAGASNLSITLYAPQGGYLNDWAVGQALAGQLRAVGVTVKVAPATDFATFLGRIWSPPGERPDDIDALLIGGGAVFLDASKALYNFQSASIPPDGYNGALYENPEFDAKMGASNKTIDDDQRAEMLCDAQKILIEDAVSIPLYTPETPVVMQSNLTGLISTPGGMILPAWVEPS